VAVARDGAGRESVAGAVPSPDLVSGAREGAAPPSRSTIVPERGGVPPPCAPSLRAGLASRTGRAGRWRQASAKATRALALWVGTHPG